VPGDGYSLRIVDRDNASFRESTGQSSLVKVNAWGILLYELGSESITVRLFPLREAYSSGEVLTGCN
jgi:hypothetical protein